MIFQNKRSTLLTNSKHCLVPGSINLYCRAIAVQKINFNGPQYHIQLPNSLPLFDCINLKSALKCKAGFVAMLLQNILIQNEFLADCVILLFVRPTNFFSHAWTLKPSIASNLFLYAAFTVQAATTYKKLATKNVQLLWFSVLQLQPRKRKSSRPVELLESTYHTISSHSFNHVLHLELSLFSLTDISSFKENALYTTDTVYKKISQTQLYRHSLAILKPFLQECSSTTKYFYEKRTSCYS